MTLSPGARIAHYHVGVRLGAGGMGEVYQARDTTLDRDVALKLLPDLFSDDVERLARLEREAKLLASLNHPNIAAIYSLEHADGIRFLVMELVPGPTLAERLQSGPLPLDEALDAACQIALALEAAHAKGIIHRDLKPANVKLTPDGRVKLLDFGLAKAFAEPEAADFSKSPTQLAATAAGLIQGTVAYMSPEQARGKHVDAQTDVWAFGCVLYEMITGRQAFAGDTLTDALAAVVKSEPDWTALPATVSGPIRSVLRRCLQKDPARRIHHIADARIALEDARLNAADATVRVELPAPARARWMQVTPWVLAAGFAAAVLLALTMPRDRAAPSGPSVRLEVNLPAGVEAYTGLGAGAAISSDGTRLAFIGSHDGQRLVYVRRLDQFEATPLRGSGAMNAFFSPDAQSIGFIQTDRVLRKISLADGLIQTVVNGADTAGAAWLSDGRIVFGRDGALWTIAASGGSANSLTTLDRTRGEIGHRWPVALPNDQTVLFASFSGGVDARIEAVSLPGGVRRTIVERGTYPMYAASGHLVFARDGMLLAAPFDVDRVEVTGPTVPMLDTVEIGATGAPLAALSGTGTLVYAPAASPRGRLVLVSRGGVEQPLNDTVRGYQYPTVSPDGTRVAVVDSATWDIWLQDLKRNTFTRVTLGDTSGNQFPIWSPDGRYLLFKSTTGVHRLDVNGDGRVETLPRTSGSDYATGMSPDGQQLLISRATADRSFDLLILPMGGQAVRPVLSTPAYEGGGRVSPDGRWIAYSSNESGRMEVYLRPLAGPDRKWPVSNEGGTHARWARNGREIFYRSGNRMMAVEVSTEPSVTLSTPKPLFEGRYSFGGAMTIATYDVTGDGRFLMVKEEPGASRLFVVLNWFEELKRRVPSR